VVEASIPTPGAGLWRPGWTSGTGGVGAAARCFGMEGSSSLHTSRKTLKRTQRRLKYRRARGALVGERGSGAWGFRVCGA
jgi:hypothetical protein